MMQPPWRGPDIPAGVAVDPTAPDLVAVLSKARPSDHPDDPGDNRALRGHWIYSLGDE